LVFWTELLVEININDLISRKQEYNSSNYNEDIEREVKQLIALNYALHSRDPKQTEMYDFYFDPSMMHDMF
jgi:hypothetical protein